MRRKFLEWLGQQKGFVTREDWYRLSITDVIKHDGLRLALLYKQSPYALVSSVFDDCTFLPWKFNKVPKAYWLEVENRKAYVEWLKDTVGVTSTSELKQTHFHENHGGGLLIMYKGSPAEVIKSLQPSNDLFPLPGRGKRGHWASLANQKEFAMNLASKLGFPWNEFDRWYSVPQNEFFDFGGSGFIRTFYKGSPFFFLKSIFPEHKWQPWRFARSTVHVMSSDEVMQEVIHHIADSKNISLANSEQWRRLTARDLGELGVAQFIKRQGGLTKVIDKFVAPNDPAV